MLCYAMLCYVMLCYAMLCYAMLCYAMLCYAMLSLLLFAGFETGTMAPGTVGHGDLVYIAAHNQGIKQNCPSFSRRLM